MIFIYSYVIHLYWEGISSVRANTGSHNQFKRLTYLSAFKKENLETKFFGIIPDVFVYGSVAKNLDWYFTNVQVRINLNPNLGNT